MLTAVFSAEYQQVSLFMIHASERETQADILLKYQEAVADEEDVDEEAYEEEEVEQ